MDTFTVLELELQLWFCSSASVDRIQLQPPRRWRRSGPAAGCDSRALQNVVYFGCPAPWLTSSSGFSSQIESTYAGCSQCMQSLSGGQRRHLQMSDIGNKLELGKKTCSVNPVWVTSALGSLGSCQDCRSRLYGGVTCFTGRATQGWLSSVLISSNPPYRIVSSHIFIFFFSSSRFI